jgi:C_GCAxxG_C_C family probable redox protein
MEDVARRSRELFESGYFCAESVLLAVAEHSGIQSDIIPRIATGFCGGISRTSGLCGALTGGVMALSMLYGRNRPGDSRDKNYELVQRLIHEFNVTFGSLKCTDLVGCDISTEAGYETFQEKNLIRKCAGFTEEATSIVMRLIAGDPSGNP